MEIDPKFSTWLSKAKIAPGGETITKWWTAIDGFPVGRDDVVQLVHVSRKEKPAAKFEDAFVKALQTVDPGFVKDDRVAMAVLAGAKLHSILKHDGDSVGKFTEILVAAAFPAGTNQPAYLTDMVNLAHQWIEDSSQDRANWEYLKAGDAALDEGQGAVDALRTILAVTAEETNMLWWLFGETSRILNKKFGEIEEGALALLVGIELADLTVSLPGPVAMKAFAQRACITARPKPSSKIDLAKAVLELDLEWRKSFAAEWSAHPFLALCPIARCVAASFGVPSNKWPAAFAEITPWPKHHKMAPSDIARQFYLELLVAESWGLAEP